jgi:hypothetical protein
VPSQENGKSANQELGEIESREIKSVVVSEEDVVEADDEIDDRPQKIRPRHIPFRIDNEVLRVSLGEPLRGISLTRVEKCGVVSIRKVALIKPAMEAVDGKQNEGWNE